MTQQPPTTAALHFHRDAALPFGCTRRRSLLSTTMKTIHVAEMIAQGGREGTVEAPDGNFRVELSKDERPGSVTPEHLFAGAYGSCYLGAILAAAERSHITIKGASLVSRVHLDEDQRGGYVLNVELRATLPGVSASDAQHIMNLAHQSCPYSKATRGNINVTLNFD